ncbi:MAG: hypothetical protein V4660_16570 [Pseudomonadota bacterium]
MNLQFGDGWGRDGNNEPAYGDGRKLSAREVYVAVDKITRADIWADRDEQIKVEEFIDDLKSGVRIDVRKGAHGDKYRYSYGRHITVVISSGCRTGNTFHLYGRVAHNGAWEIDFISTYDPRIAYHRSREVKVHWAVAPAAVVVAFQGSMPLTRQERQSGLAVVRERV